MTKVEVMELASQAYMTDPMPVFCALTPDALEWLAKEIAMRATLEEREACAKRAKTAIDPELETADGESLQQHVEDAIMARSNACSAAKTRDNTISE